MSHFPEAAPVPVCTRSGHRRWPKEAAVEAVLKARQFRRREEMGLSEHDQAQQQ